MKPVSALFIAGILSGSAALAADVDLSKLPPPAAKDGVTFQNDILPLFKASCVGCHGEQKPKGGLRLDNLDDVLKGGKEGKVVAAGDSVKSKLVIAVSQLDPESAMPPKQRPRRNRPPGGNPQNPGAPGAPAQPPAEGGNPPPPAGSPAGGPQRGPQGPPPKPLTAEQVSLVRAWIDQGAK